MRKATLGPAAQALPAAQTIGRSSRRAGCGSSGRWSCASWPACPAARSSCTPPPPSRRRWWWREGSSHGRCCMENLYGKTIMKYIEARLNDRTAHGWRWEWGRTRRSRWRTRRRLPSCPCGRGPSGTFVPPAPSRNGTELQSWFILPASSQHPPGIAACREKHGLNNQFAGQQKGSHVFVVQLHPLLGVPEGT